METRYTLISFILLLSNPFTKTTASDESFQEYGIIESEHNPYGDNVKLRWDLVNPDSTVYSGIHFKVLEFSTELRPQTY